MFLARTCVAAGLQVYASRCFDERDRVLALVPLIDYDAWMHEMAGVPAHQLLTASIVWAYQHLLDCEEMTSGWWK